jgi:hypothetical protein
VYDFVFQWFEMVYGESEVKNSRIISVLSLTALVICLALVGFPWRSQPVMANFSGILVYTSDVGSLRLSGNYTLYGSTSSTPHVRLKLFLGDEERVVEVDPSTGTFSSLLEIGTLVVEEVEACLEVNGQIVSRGRIPFSDHRSSPGVQIIRFASLT